MAGLFLGEYEYSIDQKARVAIPARFREEFKAGIVLTRGFGIDRCIIAYPIEEWKKMAEKMAALPLTDSNARRLNRTTFSNAFSFELDRQGRVILPPSLRGYAQIKDGVVIAGVHNYLEIWSKELWAAEKTMMDEQAWQIAQAAEVSR